MNLKVVMREFLRLTDLFEAQMLCVYKLTEVAMVDEYKNFMLKLF